MDLYSETIITAVNKVKNSVVKIDIISNHQKKKQLIGSGSGFVFSSDGYIFTNEHVISKSEDIRVTLLDGSVFNAEIVGKDPDSDTAIIKAFGSGYSVARLGESEKLQIGQMVIAIGNPLGYQHSVSAGILSGKGRTMQTRNGHYIEDVLQSDVQLNPGNSGGPMINSEGEVIGINTAIVYGANAISFAIAIEGVKSITDQLIKYGKVNKAYLGLIIQEIDIYERLRNYHNIKNKKGLLVTEVAGNSPAEKAGLKTRDIVVEFDKSMVSSPTDLLKLLHYNKVFNPTEIKVIRKSELKTITIMPGTKSIG